MNLKFDAMELFVFLNRLFPLEPKVYVYTQGSVISCFGILHPLGISVVGMHVRVYPRTPDDRIYTLSRAKVNFPHVN